MENILNKEEDNVFEQYQNLISELRALEENYNELKKNHPEFPIIKTLESSVSSQDEQNLKEESLASQEKLITQYNKLDQKAKQLEALFKQRPLTPKEHSIYKNLIWKMKAKKMQIEGLKV